MLDLTGFGDALDGADLVVTGEGRADSQSIRGKVLHGIGLRAKEKEVPVTAIVGGLGDGWEGLFRCGIGKVIPLVQGSVTLEDAMQRSEEVYYDAALKYFRSVKEKKDRHPEMKFYWT
jgi:glycerate kinase